MVAGSRRDQPPQPIDGSCGGARLRCNGVGGTPAQVNPPGWIAETALDKPLQLGGIGNDDRGLTPLQQLHDVLKVSRVRTERYSVAKRGRFDHVLASSIPQAAADKSHLSQSPPTGEFANRINQQHRLMIQRRRRLQVRSPQTSQSGPDDRLFNVVATFGVPRGQDQPQLRVPDSQLAVTSYGQSLLRFLSAARQPNDGIRIRRDQPGQSHRPRITSIELRRVELDVAGDRQSLGRHAQVQKPLGIFGILNADKAHSLKRRPHQEIEAAIVAEARFAQAGIDQRDWNGAAAKLTQQVRPQLEFRQNDQAGLERAV